MKEKVNENNNSIYKALGLYGYLENWIQDQLMISTLVIQKNLMSIDFIIMIIAQELLKLKILSSMRMIKLVGVKYHAM